MTKRKRNRPRRNTAAKRRDGNPRNMNNWDLVCSMCAARFSMTETIDLADGHFQKDHPGEGIQFTTVWAGVGPAPRGGFRRA